MRFRRDQRQVPGIAATVALVAVLPLLAVGWGAGASVRTADGKLSTAREVQMVSGNVVALTSLQSALAIEAYWGLGVAIFQALGLRPETAEAIIGFDLMGAYEDSITEVDDARDRASGLTPDGPDGFGVGLGQVRELVDAGVGSPRDVGVRYRLLQGDLEELERDELDRLALLGSTVAQPGADGQAVERLEVTVVLGHAVADLATNFLTISFLTQTRIEDATYELVGAEASYRQASARLNDLVADDSELAALHDAVRRDPGVIRFTQAVEVRTALLTGRRPPAEVQVGTGLNGAEVFLDSLAAIDRYGELVVAASTDVDASAAALSGEAEAERDRVLLVALGAAGMSILAILVATRWIVRPLRLMAAAANRMRDGELAVAARRVGPQEVREAVDALNDAVRSVQLAEAQATAIANEELDDPVLGQPAPGKLGLALQTALEHLGESIAERESFRRRLAHEAQHDGLTGLPNRSSILVDLEQAMARARRSGGRFAVLVIDLDGFGRVNDQLGHERADRVLRLVARRIASAARDGDHVGRLGSDEIVVIAEPIGPVADAISVAERVRAAVAATTPVGGVGVSLSASVGVAISDGAESAPDEVLRNAELAVYQAKHATSSGIEVCDQELRAQLAHRYDVEERLRAAISGHQLELYYQPTTAAAERRLVGLEALVRWPRLDTVEQPAAFIPIAERSDLIIDLDRWVIEAAARQLRGWTDHPHFGRVPLAVNVSARHLAAGGLAELVGRSLAGNRVEPGRLVVEVTESALLVDLDRAITELRRLQALGVRVAIDDFGTGYTSLGHLRQLPVDVLKLDRSLITDVDDPKEASIVKLIIDTGHLLGASVTAEGIETQRQADQLAALGSDVLQGYHFGRPVPITEIERVVVEELLVAPAVS